MSPHAPSRSLPPMGALPADRQSRIRGNPWLAALLAGLLAGCGSAPPPRAEPPALPAAFPSAAASESPALAARWWSLFGDAMLDALVDEALAANLDLRLATARIDEAAVALGLARAAQWPSVDLGAQVSRSRTSAFGSAGSVGGESSSHRVALSTTFEVDLWGRLRHATTAAQQQLLAAQQARDTVRITLAGTVAQVYFGLRALDAQLRVLDAQLRQRQESLALVERRAAGGLASALEVAQARTALAATAAQRPELLRQRAQLGHQLGALTGRLDRVLPAIDQPLPQPPSPPPGLPSQLLERRPDVAQALSTMRAAFEQFEVAHKSTWPTVALTGSFGAQSADLADLLRSGARIWSIGPSLLASVFDAGRNQARTDEARSRAEQAAIGYQKAAQTAFREVADALVAAEQGGAQAAELERQRIAAADALRIASRRHEAGYSGYLEVLDAQRGVQDAELAAVRVQQARLDAGLALVKALGGGWSPDGSSHQAGASGGPPNPTGGPEPGTGR